MTVLPKVLWSGKEERWLLVDEDVSRRRASGIRGGVEGHSKRSCSGTRPRPSLQRQSRGLRLQRQNPKSAMSSSSCSSFRSPSSCGECCSCSPFCCCLAWTCAWRLSRAEGAPACLRARAGADARKAEGVRLAASIEARYCWGGVGVERFSRVRLLVLSRACNASW